MAVRMDTELLSLRERIKLIIRTRKPALDSTSQRQAPVEASSAGADTALHGQPRNQAIDAYRGLVMFMLMAEALHLAAVAQAYPNSIFLRFLAYTQRHVDWAGVSPHDMIQPAFTFLVGAALPYSIRSRLKKGSSLTSMMGHAVWRSLLLIALGIFLRSTRSVRTNFIFEDTLSQIGLAYLAAFFIAFCRPSRQWGILAIVLGGYWLAWALYPVPGANFSYLSLAKPSCWGQSLKGFALHWNKDINPGVAFDRWFLNLFPRQAPFVANAGGYLTLNFIPTIATIILGTAVGRWFQTLPERKAIKRTAVVGAILIAGALALHYAGICPAVKRIWTPSWTLLSGGLCFWCTAAIAWCVKFKAGQRCAWPLLVVGSNSICAYMLLSLAEKPIAGSLLIHFGDGIFLTFGQGFEPLLLGFGVFAAYWCILYWMYRQKFFVRI